MNEQASARKFSAWLRVLARHEPIYFLKVHGHKHQRAGVADYWLVIKGTSVQIEMKAPTLPPIGSKIQEHELKKHFKAGGESWVANTLDACKAVVGFYLGVVPPLDLKEHIAEGNLRDVTAPMWDVVETIH